MNDDTMAKLANLETALQDNDADMRRLVVRRGHLMTIRRMARRMEKAAHYDCITGYCPRCLAEAEFGEAVRGIESINNTFGKDQEDTTRSLTFGDACRKCGTKLGDLEDGEDVVGVYCWHCDYRQRTVERE